MNNLFKKIGSRCIALLLVLTLGLNNILAADPELNEDGLVEYFRDAVRAPCTSDSGRIRKGAHRAYTGEGRSIRYEQEGGYLYRRADGSIAREIRTVYVWNLPGICEPNHGFGVLVAGLINTQAGRDGSELIETASTFKKIADPIRDTATANMAIGALARFIGSNPDAVRAGCTELVNILGVKDPKKLTSIIEKFINKAGSTAGHGANIAISAILAALGTVVSVVCVCLMLQGCAKINEESHNLHDAEVIMDTFLSMITQERYLGANILVLARDKTSIDFRDAWHRFEPPFLDFWTFDELTRFGAPIFEPSWRERSHDDPSLPSWAIPFLRALHILRLQWSPDGEVRNRLKQGKKSIEEAKKRADAALPDSFPRLTPKDSSKRIEGTGKH